MKLWPIMTMIGEREGVSVTTVRERLRRQWPSMDVSRRAVRTALRRMERVGILRSRAKGGIAGARVIWWRARRRGEDKA